MTSIWSIKLKRAYWSKWEEGYKLLVVRDSFSWGFPGLTGNTQGWIFMYAMVYPSDTDTLLKKPAVILILWFHFNMICDRDTYELCFTYMPETHRSERCARDT